MFFIKNVYTIIFTRYNERNWIAGIACHISITQLCNDSKMVLDTTSKKEGHVCFISCVIHGGRRE